VKVQPGSVIYTKSGGIHGIRNPHGSQPLRFVAFGHYSS
jgi:oxalate decarboxylase/phosphoglucose isomerase-like protein (cupin superfamily)